MPKRKKPPSRMKWIRLWTEEWLDGSVRIELEPDERGVFIDLLVLAGRSRNPGVIQAANAVPYPHERIAARLNIPLELLERTLKKCVVQKRITEDKNGIHIINWEKYQTIFEGKKKKSEREKQIEKLKELKRMQELRGMQEGKYGIEEDT